MLAVGDALAMAVMDARGFKEEDFARLHPGGILGKRLLWTVKDVMHRGRENPDGARRDQSVRHAPGCHDSARVSGRRASPISTDVSPAILRMVIFGRRLAPDEPLILQKRSSIRDDAASACGDGLTRASGDAAEALRRYRCDNLPVVDAKGRPIGILDEHGIFWRKDCFEPMDLWAASGILLLVVGVGLPACRQDSFRMPSPMRACIDALPTQILKDFEAMNGCDRNGAKTMTLHFDRKREFLRIGNV